MAKTVIYFRARLSIQIHRVALLTVSEARIQVHYELSLFHTDVVNQNHTTQLSRFL